MGSDHPNEVSDRSVPGTSNADDSEVIAAERLLLLLRAHDISHVFANLGTDHGPILEAVARLQEEDCGDELPEFVTCPHEFAGLAPITDTGYVGSRDNIVQYFQDVFDQPGVIREYCRWTSEYKPPEDPDSIVVRGLERAAEAPRTDIRLGDKGSTRDPRRRRRRSRPLGPTDQSAPGGR